MHWGPYGWGMGYGWVVMLVFWMLVIGGGVYLVQAAIKGGRGAQCPSSPLDIAKTRYAKGEITKDEFERMKNDLIKT